MRFPVNESRLVSLVEKHLEPYAARLTKATGKEKRDLHFELRGQVALARAIGVDCICSTVRESGKRAEHGCWCRPLAPPGKRQVNRKRRN